MEVSERFSCLERVYRAFKGVAQTNLLAVKERQKAHALKRLFSKGLFDGLKRFPIEMIDDYLKSIEDGKPIAFIFGEFNENLTFYPSITEKILNLHSLILFINAVLPVFINHDHLSSRLEKYIFKPYSWITQEVKTDGRTVNNYFLPKEYWEPYLQHAAKRQAEAMAHLTAKTS